MDDSLLDNEFSEYFDLLTSTDDQRDFHNDRLLSWLIDMLDTSQLIELLSHKILINGKIGILNIVYKGNVGHMTQPK